MIDIQVIGSSSAGNAYLIDDGNSRLLLECGLSVRKIKEALNHRLSSVSGCLVSHSHADHSKATKDLMKAGIDVYSSQETFDALGVSGHRAHYIYPLQQLNIQEWLILPFDTVHDSPGSLGFLIQNLAGDKLLFLTDSAFCKYKFKGITHLLIECNFSDAILEENVQAGLVEQSRRKRLTESHFSLERVLTFLEKNDLAKLREIHLLHLSRENSDEALFKREVQKLTGIPTYIAGE